MSAVTLPPHVCQLPSARFFGHLQHPKSSTSGRHRTAVQRRSVPAVQGLLADFVDFIKERKMVALDELAAEFGLRTQV